eukprot:TRINITY_DN1798_c0_g1_i2.p1 TRINITY_DN1798_c0_g1~~TRINITY_DN1798_c0_g1_i2.p1  ORF type:complete len:1159 (+),score=130.60 TRINITY_DN1798_c0_g1_i2:280-3756(+)
MKEPKRIQDETEDTGHDKTGTTSPSTVSTTVEQLEGKKEANDIPKKFLSSTNKGQQNILFMKVEPTVKIAATTFRTDSPEEIKQGSIKKGNSSTIVETFPKKVDAAPICSSKKNDPPTIAGTLPKEVGFVPIYSSGMQEEPELNKAEALRKIEEKPIIVKMLHASLLIQKIEESKQHWEILYKNQASESCEKWVYKALSAKNEHPPFVIKTEVFDKGYERKLNSLCREYFIGRTLGEITEHAAKSLDMQLELVDAEEKYRVKLLLEFGGKKLKDVLLTRSNVLMMAYQLVKTLSLMEKRGIAHFDIKPSNLVWDDEKSLLRLIDFGTAVAFYHSPGQISKSLGEYESRLFGWTRRYASPELFHRVNAKVIPQKADVFAFGVTILELVLNANRDSKNEECETEKSVWNMRAMLQDKEASKEDHNKWIERVERELRGIKEDNWLDLLIPCLNFEKEKRPTFRDLAKFMKKKLREAGYEKIIKSYRKIPIKDYKTKVDIAERQWEYYNVIWYCKQYIKGMKKKATPQFCFNNSKDVAEIYYKRGLAHLKLEEDRKAIKCLEKSRNIIEETTQDTAEKYYDIAALYNNLGIAYNNVSNKEAALKYIFKAKGIIESREEKDKPSMAAIYTNLGLVYNMESSFDEAISYLNLASEIMEKSLEANSLENANIYAVLGSVYDNKGDYTSALKYKHKAEKIRMDICHADHPDTAATWNFFEKAYNSLGRAYKAETYNSLGKAYNRLAEYNKAVDYYTKAEFIVKRNYSEDHPLLSITYKNMGDAYVNLSKYSEAVRCFKNAIRIRLRIHDEQYANMAELYGNLANAYNFFGDYKQAIICAKKDKNIRKGLKGENKYYISIACNQLGFSYRNFGKLRKGLKWGRKSEKLQKEMNTEYSPLLGATYDHIGFSYLELYDYENAVAYFNNSMEIRKKIYCADHAYIIITTYGLGLSRLIKGEPKEALEYFLRAIEMLGRKHETHSYFFGRVYGSIAAAYGYLGKQEEAVSNFVTSKSILKDAYGKSHSCLAFTYRDRGIFHNALGEYAKAMKYLRKAKKIIKDTLVEDSIYLAQVREAFGDAWKHQGKIDNAKFCYEKALKIYEAEYGPFHSKTVDLKKKLDTCFKSAQLPFILTNTIFSLTSILQVLGSSSLLFLFSKDSIENESRDIQQ